MVTKKTDEPIMEIPHNFTGTVFLGRGPNGSPIIRMHLPTQSILVKVLTFDDPDVLRDIAGDLNKAAQYLYDTKLKDNR